MGTAKNYTIGSAGVNVDKSELELDEGELREAQNAVPDVLGDGALTKRPGLLPITPDMGDAVLGGIGVPFALRVSAINGTILSGDPGPGGSPATPVSTGGTPAPGGAGGSGIPATGSGGVGGVGGGGAGVPQEVVRFYRHEATDGTVGATGLSQGFWESITSFTTAASETQRATATAPYAPTATLYGVRQKNLELDAVNYSPGENFATGAVYTVLNSGAPGSVAVLDNTIYFVPDSKANPITGNVQSVLCSYKNGGNVQQIRYVLPSLGAGHNTVILSLLAANAKIYFTVAYGNAYGQGAVYEFDPATDTAKQLGAAFITTETPYALCWHSGRVWMGTFYRSAITPGNVYWFRPAIDGVGGDTAWTLDHAMANGGGVLTLCSYSGQLYAGSYHPSGVNGLLEVRSTLGAWSTSDTIVDDGFGHYMMSAIVFGTNLYYTDCRSNSQVAIVRKFDGTTWSTAFSAGANSCAFTSSWISHGLTGVATLLFSGGIGGFGAEMFSTPDGVTWTSRTANLTNTTGLGLAGSSPAVYMVY